MDGSFDRRPRWRILWLGLAALLHAVVVAAWPRTLLVPNESPASLILANLPPTRRPEGPLVTMGDLRQVDRSVSSLPDLPAFEITPALPSEGPPERACPPPGAAAQLRRAAGCPVLALPEGRLDQNAPAGEAAAERAAGLRRLAARFDRPGPVPEPGYERDRLPEFSTDTRHRLERWEREFLQR